MVSGLADDIVVLGVGPVGDRCIDVVRGAFVGAVHEEVDVSVVVVFIQSSGRGLGGDRGVRGLSGVEVPRCGCQHGNFTWSWSLWLSS